MNRKLGHIFLLRTKPVQKACPFLECGLRESPTMLGVLCLFESVMHQQIGIVTKTVIVTRIVTVIVTEPLVPRVDLERRPVLLDVQVKGLRAPPISTVMFLVPRAVALAVKVRL